MGRRGAGVGAGGGRLRCAVKPPVLGWGPGLGEQQAAHSASPSFSRGRRPVAGWQRGWVGRGPVTLTEGGPSVWAARGRAACGGGLRRRNASCAPSAWRWVCLRGSELLAHPSGVANLSLGGMYLGPCLRDRAGWACSGLQGGAQFSCWVTTTSLPLWAHFPQSL